MKRWIFFTDLDGTLLDEKTYAFDAALPALAALRAGEIPLVLCSSKTRSEMREWWAQLGLSSPFVYENGGAIWIPAGYFEPMDGERVVTLGARREVLVTALSEMACETGSRLKGFSSMSPEEVAERTGLDLKTARLALQREHDEPFLLSDEGPLGELRQAARRRGLRVTRGGRFFHLTDEATDKGKAVRTLLDLQAKRDEAWMSVALGDAAIDLEMLLAVDRPILMPQAHGRVEETLGKALPGAECAPGPGPSGWNAAVLAVLKGGRVGQERRCPP